MFCVMYCTSYALLFVWTLYMLCGGISNVGGDWDVCGLVP